MNIMLQYYHYTFVICFLTNYGMLNIYEQNINLLELSNHLMEKTLAQTHTHTYLCMCACICVYIGRNGTPCDKSELLS